MTDTPVRPRWNHTCVKDEAASEIIEDVLVWGRTVGLDPAKESDTRAMVHLAMRETPDAFGALRYLDDFVHWPVDDALYQIFAEGFRLCHRIVDQHVHAWVMKNNIRVPAKEGDRISFRSGSVEMSGTVIAVIRREARVIAALGDKASDIPPMSVEIEQITDVKPPRKSSRKPAPPEPPMTA